MNRNILEISQRSVPIEYCLSNVCIVYGIVVLYYVWVCTLENQQYACNSFSNKQLLPIFIIMALMALIYNNFQLKISAQTLNRCHCNHMCICAFLCISIYLCIWWLQLNLCGVPFSLQLIDEWVVEGICYFWCFIHI